MKAFIIFIRDFLVALFKFLRDAYSDDGSPSSGRILTTILAIVASKILLGIFAHITSMSDSVALGLWLGSLPLIVSALVFFFTAPYGVSKGSGTISDIINAITKKNQP